DVLHIVETAHVTDTAADQIAEDDKVQRHGDRRWQQRLRPDAGKAADFLDQDGEKRHPLFAQTHAVTSVSRLRSTRRRNSSSSRLALLRMLITAISCAASCVNTSL